MNWAHHIENGGPFEEYIEASIDIGDIPAAVCLTHMRFVPCRKKDGCVFSEDPEDVRRVAEYQLEDTAWEILPGAGDYEKRLNEGK